MTPLEFVVHIFQTIERQAIQIFHPKSILDLDHYLPRRVVRCLDRRAEEIEQLIQECESTLPVAKRPCLQDEPVFCPVPKLSDLCFQAIRNADIGMQIELRRKQHEIESLRNELKSIKFCAERFTGNDAKIHFYTGFVMGTLHGIL